MISHGHYPHDSTHYADKRYYLSRRHESPVTAWIRSEERNYTYTVYQGPAAIAMGVLAVNTLAFSALLAGLILGLCSVNMTLVELRAATATPKERKQAAAVARLKKHHTWMLCSLILVSVAFGESFPFLIQSIYPFDQLYVAIIISTLCIALFGEILPQYIVPRRAIAWGYYCRPIVWGCMFLTAIISYPIAWCLDRVGGQRDALELFTNEELGGLIRHHEKREKNGGDLGQDASRIMLGALKLDSRKIGGEITAVPEPENREQDLEKADLVVVQGMIVKWSAVKVICIDERVDEALIKKVRSWSYSRIPVIGNLGKGREGEDVQEWTHGTQIHGFLHIKNLLGLNIKFPEHPENPLLVKDLPMYPLPIVREDMSVYELLNMFQSGMSRMAVVIPNDQLTCSKGAVWTTTERTNEQTFLKLEKAQEHRQWSIDYLAAARAAADKDPDEKHQNPGIRSPRPIGIVTFEDIIDAILQKTSRDETDFYDRQTLTPPTKTRKAGDFPIDMAALATAHAKSDCTVHHASIVTMGPYELARNTLRRRKVTNDRTICALNTSNDVANSRQSAPGGLDGADENSFEAGVDEIKIKKTRGEYATNSLYTQNRRGGFHADESSHTDKGNLLTAEDIAKLVTSSSPKSFYESNTMRSLPSRRAESRTLSDELKQTFRHVSAAPKLPTVRRVTPFSRDTGSGSVKESNTGSVKDAMGLVMPTPSTSTAGGSGIGCRRFFNPNASGFDVTESMEEFFERAGHTHVQEKSGDTLSFHSSFDEQGNEDDEDLSCLYDAFPVPLKRATPEVSQHTHHSLTTIEEVPEKKYDGFPMELLDDNNKENRTPKYISSTLPRTGTTDIDMLESIRKKSPHERKNSFSSSDDRALLPSQRRALNWNEESITGIRSTSLWF
ncbi:hypothetical protein BDZ45DRAFT_60775 [Acephala macrosclerotiorum]|nr:hypothetical protein BDZ45DRAFT_60775 [Acephala macrosclerotiorum]